MLLLLVLLVVLVVQALKLHDAPTRARVFKSLSARLADGPGAAHFLSVPYQFLRWCCSEGDVASVRDALREIADDPRADG